MQVKKKAAIYNVEDKPGQGIYECLFCLWTAKLEDNEKLPVCGNCKKGENTKYASEERWLGFT